MTLYAASVPVLRHYLGRAAAIVGAAPEAALAARLADAFPAGQQFTTAAGYALRIACPLAGHPVPEPTGPGPLARIAQADTVLAALRPEDFRPDRIIRHRAGEADLEQDAATFLHLYGLPNFFFHLTMGFATLRAAGVAIGKADFDGQHSYPAGFRFS